VTFSRWKKLLEEPKGTGQVRTEDETVDGVSFSLRVEAEELVAKTFAGKPKARLIERKTVTGRIQIPEGSALVLKHGESSGPLTLVLNDGRELDFEIVERHSRSAEYIIKGIADIRRRPE
jgi:hypothetical protein